MSQGNSSNLPRGFGNSFYGAIGLIFVLIVAIALGVLIGNLLTLYVLYRYLEEALGGTF